MKKLLAKILGKYKQRRERREKSSDLSQKQSSVCDSVLMLVAIPDGGHYAAVVEYLSHDIALHLALGYQVQVKQLLKHEYDTALLIFQYYDQGQLTHQKARSLQLEVVSETRVVAQDVSVEYQSTGQNDPNLRPVLSQKGADTYPYADPYIRNINKAIILKHIQQNLKL